MTSTRSAADTGLPEQPAALSIAALTSAITVPTTAHEVGPIESAYPDWIERMRRSDEAGSALSEIEDNFEEPERPRWHPVLEEGGYITLVGDRPGRYRTCLDDREKNVAWLRDRIARKSVEGWDAGMLDNSAKRAQASLDKILAWRAERDRRRDALGLPAAEAHAQQLEQAANEAKTAILAIEPTTYREAAFQAAVVYTEWDQSAAARLLGKIQKLAGIASYDEED